MAGTWRQIGLGVLVALGLGAPAGAQAVYYPYPSYYLEGCGGVPYYYAPATLAPSYARPTPAPPSQRLMPPAEGEKTRATAKVVEKKMPPIEKVAPKAPPAEVKIAPPEPKVTPAEAKEPAPPADEKKAEKRAPTVTEARFQGPAPAVPGERCKVGFWNISGRDVTLTVAGSARKLQKDRAITLELPREFTWKVDQGTEHTERIAAGLPTHEVVIRE